MKKFLTKFVLVCVLGAMLLGIAAFSIPAYANSGDPQGGSQPAPIPPKSAPDTGDIPPDIWAAILALLGIII